MIGVAVSAVWAAALVVVAFWWLHRPTQPSGPVCRSVLDERLLATVVVTLKSGTAFRGVLYAEDSGAVVLCNAEQLTADGATPRADGEIIILREDVDYVQRP